MRPLPYEPSDSEGTEGASRPARAPVGGGPISVPPAGVIVASTTVQPVTPATPITPTRPSVTPAIPEGSDAETAELRGEIEQTRAELSGTIDAIQQRLEPKHLIEEAKDAAKEVVSHAVTDAKDAVKDAATGAVGDAKDAVREATIGKAEHLMSSVGETVSHLGETVSHMGGSVTSAAGGAASSAGHVAQDVGGGAKGFGSNVLDIIKANPIPAALAGLSLGYLFLNGRKAETSRPTGQAPAPASYGAPSSGASRYGTAAYPTGGYGTAAYGTPPPPSDAGSSGIGGAVAKVGDTAGDLVDEGKEKVAALAGGTKDVAGQAASAAGHAVSNVGEKAGEVASTAGHAAQGAGGTLFDTVKQNPVPAALTGLGLLWLYRNRADSGGPSSYPATAPQSGSSSFGYGTGYRAGAKVGDFASQAIGNVGGMAGGARESVAGATGRAQNMFERRLNETPLAVGAVALGIGAAIGLAAPSTQQETKLLGSAGANLIERAQDAAKDVSEKVQQVAGEAGRTVKEEAQSQGLTS